MLSHCPVAATRAPVSYPGYQYSRSSLAATDCRLKPLQYFLDHVDTLNEHVLVHSELPHLNQMSFVAASEIT